MLPIHLHPLTVHPDPKEKTVDHEMHLDYTYFRRGGIPFEEMKHQNHLWMVQMIPNKFDDKQFFDVTGCSTHTRFHGHSFKCYTTYERITKAKEVPGVSWIGTYKPEYKFPKENIHRAHQTHHTKDTFAVKVYVTDTKVVNRWKHYFKHHHWENIHVHRVSSDAIVVSSGMPKHHSFVSPIHWETAIHPQRTNIPSEVHVQLQDMIDFLAAQSETFWIEPHVPVHTHNKFASPFMHNHTSGGAASGSGHVITIGDTGVDIQHCMFKDTQQDVSTTTLLLKPGEIPDVGSYNYNHRKIINYVRFDFELEQGESMMSDFTDFENGHGTHVMGSAVGSGNEWNGTAPEAKLLALDFGFHEDGESYLYVPQDIRNHILEWIVRDTESKIFSVSWGSDINMYTDVARQMDDFMFDNDDFVILVANGNTGDLGPGSVGTPATAKNVISIGSTFNTHDSFVHVASNGHMWVEEGGTSPIWLDHVNNHPTLYSTNSLAYFSSQGPTDDGRIKPDILAPGTAIVSSRSQNGCNVMVRHGTSMSTPLVAGLVTTIRDVYPSSSSAAVKAILIQVARPVQYRVAFQDHPTHADKMVPVLISENPSMMQQGFGVVQLESSTIQALHVVDRETIQQGEIKSYCFTSAPHFRVTLVWTDPVAPLGARTQLVHDIDVEVVHNNNRVHGNKGTKPDTLNNVEQIDVEANGPLRVLVHGTRIFGQQKYSIIFSHAPESGGTCNECAPNDPPRECRLTNGWGIQHCSTDGSLQPCMFETCDDHYTYHEGQCVADPSCTTVCHVPHGVGLMCNGECKVSYCDPGFFITGTSVCTCFEGMKRSCPLIHGTGQQQCDASGAFTSCKAIHCDPYYSIIDDGSCFRETTMASIFILAGLCMVCFIIVSVFVSRMRMNARRHIPHTNTLHTPLVSKKNQRTSPLLFTRLHRHNKV